MGPMGAGLRRHAHPLTIGREEGNPIQLNDERISRFHLKIQEDQHKIVLTDLQSTNGTKVNGESVQVWVLRPGDVISLGRTVLVFGSRDEIAAAAGGPPRRRSLGGRDAGRRRVRAGAEYACRSTSSCNFRDDPDAQAILHTLAPPELPGSLSPARPPNWPRCFSTSRLRMRGLLQSVKAKGKGDQMTLEQREWQNLIDLQDRLAGYLRQIGEPSG